MSREMRMLVIGLILMASAAGTLVLQRAVVPGAGGGGKVWDGAVDEPRDTADVQGAATAEPADAPVAALLDVSNGSPFVEADRKEAPRCTAWAPTDWFASNHRGRGDRMEISSPDRSAYAGWWARTVNRAMESYYGPMYGDPEAASLATVDFILEAMSSVGEPRFTAAPRPLASGFLLRPFESASHKGIVVYRTYPAPRIATPGSYVLSIRTAIAEKRSWDDGAGRIAPAVALSIGCASTVGQMGGAAGGGNAGGAKGGNARDSAAAGDRQTAPSIATERLELEGVDGPLGIAWAHSESSGKRYLVDPATWNRTGPAGAGHYMRVDDGWERLAPGW